MTGLILILLLVYLIFAIITYALMSLAAKYDDDPLSSGQMVFLAIFPVANLFMFGFTAWILIIKSLE